MYGIMGRSCRKKLYNLYLVRQKVDYYYLALLLTPGRNIVGAVKSSKEGL